MCCLATVAQGSSAILAVVSPADVSQLTLHCVSLATAANVSPATVANQSCESWCQELVLWQAQRLAFDNVDSLTP